MCWKKESSSESRRRGEGENQLYELENKLKESIAIQPEIELKELKNLLFTTRELDSVCDSVLCKNRDEEEKRTFWMKANNSSSISSMLSDTTHFGVVLEF